MRSVGLIVFLFIFGFQLSGCGYFGASSDEVAEPVAAVEPTEEAAVSPEPAIAVETEEEPAVAAEPEKPQMFEPGAFESPENCKNCHRDIYNDWSKSMHAYAWTDKWYQPDFLMGHAETDGATDLLCGACHAPIAARTGQLPPADGSNFDETAKRGISCDFCHTVSGIAEMKNMGHISEPGDTKIGPRGDGRSLYHEVKTVGIHDKAEFCGACHMVVHPANGTHIIDTWVDYKSTEYAEQGITCQDCHMTPTPGVQKTPGRAALLGIKRDNLAYHGFVGASSYAQDAMGNAHQAEMSREYLRSAAEMKLAENVSADGTLDLTVEVHNVGAGHKIPTGTTYIRIVWLQVEVLDQAGKLVYSSGQIDENNQVDPNAVFFRVLFKDADGNLTGKSWRAQGIGYDRRIPAKGMDSETYHIALPAKGEYQVNTRLMYRSFTQEALEGYEKLTGQKLPPLKSVEMASAQTKVVF